MDITGYANGAGRLTKEDSTIVNIADRIDEYFGGKGFTYIADTVEVTAAAGYCFNRVQVVTTATLTSFTADATAPVTGTITAVAFPVGTIINGKFTKLRLASGSVIAYKGVL